MRRAQAPPPPQRGFLPWSRRDLIHFSHGGKSDRIKNPACVNFTRVENPSFSPLAALRRVWSVVQPKGKPQLMLGRDFDSKPHREALARDTKNHRVLIRVYPAQHRVWRNSWPTLDTCGALLIFNHVWQRGRIVHRSNSNFEQNETPSKSWKPLIILDIDDFRSAAVRA